LRLDRQQPPGNLLGTARWIAAEQLCRASFRGHRQIVRPRGRLGF
jgi:hypothetical protein